MALSITAGSTTKEALARNMNKSGVGGVIGAVNAGNYTDKRPGNAGNFRVDNQNPTTTHANLQVQVNGITGEKSSIGGALIPLALRGVKYRPLGAAILLRRNLLIYGLGGVIAPFLGIKLIDILIGWMHLA